MTDTKWTAIAAFGHAAAHVIQVAVDRKKHPDNDVALHERVAILEKKVEDLESRNEQVQT